VDVRTVVGGGWECGKVWKCGKCVKVLFSFFNQSGCLRTEEIT